jgi:hypothetical protein
MLRLRDGQTELFDALMPPDARVLSTELAKVGEQLAILFQWRGADATGRRLVICLPPARLIPLPPNLGQQTTVMVNALQSVGAEKGPIHLDMTAAISVSSERSASGRRLIAIVPMASNQPTGLGIALLLVSVKYDQRILWDTGRLVNSLDPPGVHR